MSIDVKLDENFIIDNSLKNNELYNFYSKNLYVCFLNVLSLKLPVTKFTINTKINSSFGAEVFILSSSAIEVDEFYKKEACIHIFENENRCLKKISLIIYQIYSQGISYLLDPLTQKPTKIYLYKIILFTSLHQLSFKKRNHIYHSETEKPEITKLDIIKKILKNKDEKYNYDISFNENLKENLKKFITITQYDETDYDFIIRMATESLTLLYYDFAFDVPILNFGEKKTSIIKLKKPDYLQENYQFDEIEEIIIGNDGTFKAVISSYNIYAGNIFSYSNNLDHFFVTESEIKLEYNVNAQWILINYVKGIVLNHLENFKNELKMIGKQNRPIINGSIKGIVVTNKKHTFNVDQAGRIKVRLLWDSIVKDSEPKIFSIITQDLSQQEQKQAKIKQKTSMKDGVSSVEFTQNKLDEFFDKQWDLSYQKENITSWIAIANWGCAGDSFGNSNFPRGSEEVLVWFLNGNPEHPIVMGNMFNESNIFPNINSFNQSKSTSQKAFGFNNADISYIEAMNVKTFLSHLLDFKIPPDIPVIIPNINETAADLVFKHFSYDESKETKSIIPKEAKMLKDGTQLAGNMMELKDIISKNKDDLDLLDGKLDTINLDDVGNEEYGYNEIYMQNKYKDETIHIISSNLVNVRTKKDLHIEIKGTLLEGFDNQRESVLNLRQTYIFGQDSLSVFNNTRITYFAKYNAENLTEIEAIMKRNSKIAFVKSNVETYVGPLGSTNDLNIYDDANQIKAFISGFWANIAFKSNVNYVVPAGFILINSNLLTFTTLGAQLELIAGKKDASVAGYYSLGVIGRLSISSLFFEMKSKLTTSWKVMNLSINSLKLCIVAGPFQLKALDMSLTTASLDLTSIKLDITAVDVDVKVAKFEIKKCASFVLTSKVKIDIKSAIFSLKSLSLVQLKAAIVNISK